MKLHEIRLKKTLENILDMVEDCSADLGASADRFRTLLTFKDLKKSVYIDGLTQKLSDLENDLLDFVEDVEAEIEIR